MIVVINLVTRRDKSPGGASARLNVSSGLFYFQNFSTSISLTFALIHFIEGFHEIAIAYLSSTVVFCNLDPNRQLHKSCK
jgi:hypothetical protein